MRCIPLDLLPHRTVAAYHALCTDAVHGREGTFSYLFRGVQSSHQNELLKVSCILCNVCCFLGKVHSSVGFSARHMRLICSTAKGQG